MRNPFFLFLCLLAALSSFSAGAPSVSARETERPAAPLADIPGEETPSASSSTLPGGQDKSGRADSSQVTTDWRELAPGLELCEGRFHPSGAGARAGQPDFVILRVNPDLFTFSLHMASEGQTALSLEDWAKKYGLVAAVNASMYLPDNLTSTGFMRGPEHVNNPRLHGRFGAFFVAGLKDKTLGGNLPEAAVLDKFEFGEKLGEILDKYEIVVQNFRVVSAEGEVLWPDGGKKSGVALIGGDSAGRVLFVVGRAPLSTAGYARLLLGLDIGLRVLMYVEGGSEAGLLAREKGGYSVWRGSGFGLFRLGGSAGIVLPNIIGVRPKIAAE